MSFCHLQTIVHFELKYRNFKLRSFKKYDRLLKNTCYIFLKNRCKDSQFNKMAFEIDYLPIFYPFFKEFVEVFCIPWCRKWVFVRPCGVGEFESSLFFHMFHLIFDIEQLQIGIRMINTMYILQLYEKFERCL